jgi:transcription-repair coupling factor (superfamily II helicase)
VQRLLQLLELKLLAKRCGFSRIKLDKPNIALETPMKEPAFRLLRQGLPQHLHDRFVYQAGAGSTAKVLAWGLGVLPIERQVEELMGWLRTKDDQIPGSDGLQGAQRVKEGRGVERGDDHVLNSGMSNGFRRSEEKERGHAIAATT